MQNKDLFCFWILGKEKEKKTNHCIPDTLAKPPLLRTTLVQLLVILLEAQPVPAKFSLAILIEIGDPVFFHRSFQSQQLAVLVNHVPMNSLVLMRAPDSLTPHFFFLIVHTS